MQAGRLDSRVRFERRAGKDDGYGNTKTWASPVALMTVWAGFRPQFGREALAAGRLQSTMVGTLTIRRSNAAMTITSSDRAVFVAGPYAGKVCQIRSIVPTMDRAGIEMLLEEGVAT